MESIGIKPDTICYNSAIHAHKKSSHPLAASRAAALYERMKGLHLHPLGVTFNLLIVACNDHDDLLMDLFQDCIEKGMLDKKVVESFSSGRTTGCG